MLVKIQPLAPTFKLAMNRKVTQHSLQRNLSWIAINRRLDRNPIEKTKFSIFTFSIAFFNFLGHLPAVYICGIIAEIKIVWFILSNGKTKILQGKRTCVIKARYWSNRNRNKSYIKGYATKLSCTWRTILLGTRTLNKSLCAKAILLTALVLTMTGTCLLNCFAPASSAVLVQDNLVAEMISKMNTTEIYNTVYALQNLTTRIYGYSGNVEAATYLYNRLSNISGLSVEYQSNYNNIVATLPGMDSTSNVNYVVGAHYDSISSNQSYAPGATDDGGGVAIVLEFARIMSQYSFNHTLKFAFWNCEENGELGSTEYVKYAYNNKINVSLYMNFDSSCYDPDNRMVLEIMTNQQSSWVSNMMTEYNTLYGINFALNYNTHNCSSDQSPFWDYGYTAVMTHSESHGPQHTSDDTIDKVSTTYANKNGQLGMSVLAALAEVQGINTHPIPTSTLPQIPSPTPSTIPTLSPTLIPAVTQPLITTPTSRHPASPSSSSSPIPSPNPVPPEFPLLVFLIVFIAMFTPAVVLIVRKRGKTLKFR